MKIGFVGYQGSGKSTLFSWLSDVTPDPALAHTVQSAMVEVPDERIERLYDIYQPKKITRAGTGRHARIGSDTRRQRRQAGPNS